MCVSPIYTSKMLENVLPRFHAKRFASIVESHLVEYRAFMQRPQQFPNNDFVRRNLFSDFEVTPFRESVLSHITLNIDTMWLETRLIKQETELACDFWHQQSDFNISDSCYYFAVMGRFSDADRSSWFFKKRKEKGEEGK